MEERSKELAVLATAGLATFLEGSDELVGDQTALLVLCVHAMGAGMTPIVPDLVTLSENRILRRQKERGMPVPPPEVTAAAVVEVPSVVVKNGQDGMHLTGKGELVNRVLAAVGTVSVRSAQSTETLVRAVGELRREIGRLREESNILWWVFGGISRDELRPIAQLRASEAAVLAGAELADLVEGLPGPLAARAFLHQVISSAMVGEEPVTLANALVSCSERLVDRLARRLPERVATLLPIHSAARAFRELRGGDGWTTLAHSWGGVDPTSEVRPEWIAEQVYREVLVSASLEPTP
jgi:hypothetical protein